MWKKELYAGFRFVDGPIDLDAVLCEHGRFPRRHLRLKVAVPASIWLGTEARPAAVQNLSQSGAMVLSETPLPVGARLVLAEPHLGERAARVCWRREVAHGLVFAAACRFDELASIADRLRRDSEGAVRHLESSGEAPLRYLV